MTRTSSLESISTKLERIAKQARQAPVEEIDVRGRKHRTTPGEDRGRGCPQGAPIGRCYSPRTGRVNSS
jgi:hypothetical protein